MAVICVNASPDLAFSIVRDAVVNGSLSGECVDTHEVTFPGGGRAVLGIFERYSWRNSNRMSLTVLCSSIGQGRTEVYFVGSGASDGFLGFDWGASESFERKVEKALQPYV